MAKRTVSSADSAGNPAWLDAKLREQEARFQAFFEAEMSRMTKRFLIAWAASLAISIAICGAVAAVT